MKLCTILNCSLYLCDLAEELPFQALGWKKKIGQDFSLPDFEHI